jgi:ketosteroid isomerase-like protein
MTPARSGLAPETVSTRARVREKLAPADVTGAREIHQDLLQRIYDAANRGDFEAMLEPFHEDVAWETPTHWIHGRSKLLGWLVGWHASYAPHHEPEEFIPASDDVVIVFVNISYERRPDNRPAHVWTIRDGVVTHVRVFPSRDKALEEFRAQTG